MIFHLSRTPVEILREFFTGRLVSLRGNISLPAYSPDLSSCDNFLLGYLKIPTINQRLPVRKHFSS